MTKYCCEDMEYHLNYKCNVHSSPFDCVDSLLIYNDVMNEYGLIVHDGGSSYISIKYCPFCGTEFSESKRDLFFDVIEHLGFEICDNALPKEFKSDEWWKKRGL